MKFKSGLLIIATVLFSALFIQCSEEDDDMNKTSKMELKITDAPSDDANIQGTFVTVSDVKIDGQSVEGFSKQTIEISAYQQGNAKMLVDDEVEAKSYNSISLVLDYETDEQGNSPGCYVLTDNNTKHDLKNESQAGSEITFTSDFEVGVENQNTWVIDFDLRKAVARENDNTTETEYTFVTSSEMNNTFRIVKEDDSGEIHGNVTGSLNSNDELYVYAYEKGEFNSSAETQGEGSNNVMFANAVTSAKVNADGSYTLAFLNEGDYEVHVATYEKNDDEKSEFKTLVSIESSLSGMLLNNISVTSETTLEVDIDILGIM